MSGAVDSRHEVVRWGWAGSALHAQSGDVHVVRAFPGGALVGLIDGLGHGPDAAAAATTAAAVLAAHAAEPPTELVQRCHLALRRTRGVVMSVAAFHVAASSLTWLAIGNVDCVVVRNDGAHDEGIIGRGGVVGYRIPALQSATIRVSHGDTLIMATDGIHSTFSINLPRDHDPQQLADLVLARFATGTDDARVVVARYLGDRDGR